MSITRSLGVVALVTLAVNAVPVRAQQPNEPQTQVQRPSDPASVAPTPAQQPSEQPASMAKGQIVRVDSSAKTITIKTETEPQMRFLYNDATKVVGAGETVAGLATLSGSDVTVKYTTRGQDHIATEINVQKPKA